MFHILENEFIKKLLEFFEANIQIINGKMRKGKDLILNIIKNLPIKLKNIKYFIKDFISQLYWPSIGSLFTIIIIWSLFFYLSYLRPKFAFLYDGQYQHLINIHVGNLVSIDPSDLVATHAGISALIFALIIFIAQNTKEYDNKGRVLLKVSFLFPLLIATILGFFNFIWGDVSFGSIVFTFGIGAFLIISVYNLILVILDKHLYFEKYLELLDYSSNKDFKRIMDPDINNEHKRFRSELKDYRDRFIAGIHTKHIGKVEESLEIYQVLIKNFIKIFEQYGKIYSSDKNGDAVKNRLNNVVEWFSEDISEIFKTGMDSHNKDIISKVYSLTIVTAWRGIHIKNFTLFSKFMEFIRVLYRSSQNEPNELKSIMVAKSKAHLKETSDKLQIELERSDSESLLILKDFVLKFLFISQGLLEEAKKQNDLESYKGFINSVKRLFEEFSPSSQDLQFKLANYDLSKDEIEKLSKELENKVILEKIVEETNIRKNQMLFGLTTWISSIFMQNPTSTDLKGFFLESCKSLPNIFEDFTEVFLSSHTVEADNFWYWDRWESFPDDRAISIDTIGKLERFYAIGALKIIKRMREYEIKNINLHYDNEDYIMDLALLSKRDTFIQFLDKIDQNPDEWEFILNQEEIDCITTFRNILNKSDEIWHEIEKNKIREGIINNKKVEEFKDQAVKSFNKNVKLRKLFKYFGLYTSINENKLKNTSLKKLFKYFGIHDSVEEDESRFGLNIIDNKAIFFEKWHMPYPHWGTNYGKTMAISEDVNILKTILNQCSTLPEEDFDEILDRSDLSESIILVTGSKSYQYINSGEFWRKHDSRCPRSDINDLDILIGYYTFHGQNIPICGAFNDKIDGIFIFIKTSNLGKLTQYLPLDSGEDPQLVKDIFYMNIRSFSEDSVLIKEMLDNPSEELEKIGNIEEQRKYLEENVWIQMFERFEFEKDVDFEGYFIEFADD